MNKIFSKIIKFRIPVLIITAILFAVCMVQLFRTNLNSDVTSYLSDDTPSKQAMNILRDEFDINGDALVCLEGNAESYDEIAGIIERIDNLEETKQVLWLGTYDQLVDFAEGVPVSTEHMIPDENITELIQGLYLEYEGKNYYVLNISLNAPNASEEAGKSIHLIQDILNDYSGDYSLGGTAVQSNNMLESAMGEVPMFMLVAAVVIGIILMLTSKSFVAALIFLLTIGISIVFNLGTNFFTKSISTVTFSVAAILQLALSMDYSIFLTHAYEKARELEDDQKAMLTAIRKTLVVISASALTTVAGFCALFVMKYRMGFDLGLCLAKGVSFSFLTVIIVQPCLMTVLQRACDRTQHNFLNPSFKRLSCMPKKLEIIAPVIAAVLLVPAIFLATSLDYYYLDSNYDNAANGTQAAVQEVGNQSVFVFENTSAQEQLNLIKEIKRIRGVTEVTGYYALLDTITDGITVPIYSSLTTQNPNTLLYNMKLSSEDVLKMLSTTGEDASEQIEANLPAGIPASYKNVIVSQLSTMRESMSGFVDQLEQYGDQFFAEKDGKEYTFITVKVSGEAEGADAMNTVTKISETISRTLKTDQVIATGNTQVVMDMEQATERDFIMVSILSAVLILLILIITFKGLLTPILLVMVIELAILINLSISKLTGSSLNFMSYVIISAIQLGATIDYAILMTNNYYSALKTKSRYEAVAEAVCASAFPIIVSVSILCGACLSVYFVASDAIIREITMLIARGSLISGLLVLLVLPTLLLMRGKKNDHFDFMGLGKLDAVMASKKHSPVLREPPKHTLPPLGKIRDNDSFGETDGHDRKSGT